MLINRLSALVVPVIIPHESFLSSSLKVGVGWSLAQMEAADARVALADHALPADTNSTILELIAKERIGSCNMSNWDERG